MMSRTKALLLVTVFVAVAAIVPVAVAGSNDTTDHEVFVEGEFTDTVPAKETGRSTFLWESQPNTLVVRFNASNESSFYKVCVQNETGQTAACQYKELNPSNRTATFDYDNLSSFEGSNNITVVLWDEFPAEPKKLGTDTINISIIRKDGDIDGDKLTNANELANNSSMFLMDTDNDSLGDGAEVINYGTSPAKADTDADNLTDAAELSRSLSPTDPDTDDDGIPDGVEVEHGSPPKDATADTDGDGLSDSYEYKHNSSFVDADTDGDGLSDGFETRLGTETSDGTTTPMLLFASGTLFGILTVCGRWFFASSRYQLEGTISSWFSKIESLFAVIVTVVPGFEPESDPAPESNSESESSPSRPSAAQKFDRLESQQASQRTSTGEEKVLKLLRENDGWVYQSTIVERTNWSKSKVSRLLSKMSDNGMVEKISVGRQNIVAEAGAMPEGAKSPFDE